MKSFLHTKVMRHVVSPPISVILREAKDLRGCFGLNCSRVVFRDNIAENQDRTSGEMDSPEVLRFAQDDSVIASFAPLRMTGFVVRES